MIFVTVGTHEQPFDRLVRCVDELKRDGRIREDVFIQTGYSSYEPKYCKWASMLLSDEMDKLVEDAHIVIAHAGPSSFLAPLKLGKIPIVVPRMKQFCEHVNDHQVKFARAVAERQNNIILVEDISTLGDIIENYDDIALGKSTDTNSNNEAFIREFEMVVADLMSR